MSLDREACSQFQATSNYELHTFGDELVLYPVNEYKTDSLLVLNIIGKKIYEGITSGKTPDQIATALSSFYAVNGITAHEDVESCIRLLVENKALREAVV